MKKLILLFSAILFVISSAAQAEVIAKDYISDKQGSTRSKGSYSIEKIGDNVKLAIKFDVRKSGIAGSGKGEMTFQILDDSWETLTSFNKKFTVGSNAWKGTAHKRWKEKITLTGAVAKKVIERGVIVAFMVKTNKDTTFIPTSINDWKEAIGDLAELKSELDKLTVGDSKKVNAWNFLKMNL